MTSLRAGQDLFYIEKNQKSLVRIYLQSINVEKIGKHGHVWVLFKKKIVTNTILLFKIWKFNIISNT